MASMASMADGLWQFPLGDYGPIRPRGANVV